MNWGMRPDFIEIIWSNKIVAPSMVYEGFLIDLTGLVPLFLHGLLWYLTNKQATKGEIFLTLLILLGSISFLDNLTSNLKVKWFSL